MIANIHFITTSTRFRDGVLELERGTQLYMLIIVTDLYESSMLQTNEIFVCVSDGYCTRVHIFLFKYFKRLSTSIADIKEKQNTKVVAI